MSDTFPPVCLSIGASDCTGAAGVQADCKTFISLGCYGTSVVTVLSARGLAGVQELHQVPEKFIRQQLDAIAGSLPIAAVKVGFMTSASAIRCVGRWLRERQRLPVVVDPVATDSRGIALLQPEALQAMHDELLPRAAVITPNRFEAALLTQVEECLSVEDMQEAARSLHRRHGCSTLVTGGILDGRSLDVLAGIDGINRYDAEWCPRGKVHGVGSAHSAAIAAGLARGDSLREAVLHAKLYISSAITAAPCLDDGAGIIWHGAGGGPDWARPKTDRFLARK